MKFIKDLKDEQLSIEDEITDLVYFARIDWTAAWGMSHYQRQRIAKRVSKYRRIESGAPELLGE
jgi:hypothetical protein